MAFKRIATLLVFAALIFPGIPPAHAIDVTPMVVRITPTGPTSSYRLSIKNTEDQPVTVEIQVFRMEVDVDGRKTLSEESDDIVVFPPQSVIPANREQVVQVRYVGGPQASAMYLVKVGQLPITFASDGSEPRGAAVQVAFNISTHVLLAPAGATPDLKVVSARRADNGDVVIVAENQGAGFASLRQARYTLTGADGRSHEVPAQSVVLGEVSNLAGGATRNINIPAALVPGISADVSATIELT